MKIHKKRKTSPALSTCPVDAEGWCPYPFSIAQLKKRLKKLQQETEQEEKILVLAGARKK